MVSLQAGKHDDQYMSLSDLESLTHGTIEGDKIQADTYESDREIGPRNLDAANTDVSMSVVIEMAQKQLEATFQLPQTGTSRIEMTESKGSSACIQIGDVALIDFAGVCINKKWIKGNQSEELIRQNAILYQKYYRGLLTESQAEELCKSRSEWVLYHHVPITLYDASRSYSESRDFPSSAQLFIAYRRRDSGLHEHYQVRSTSSKHRRSAFYVDYGDPEAPHFPSIYGLLSYYDVYCHLNVRDTYHADSEAFPLWNRANPIGTVSEYSIISSDPPSWLPDDTIFDATTVSTFSSSDEADCNL